MNRRQQLSAVEAAELRSMLVERLRGLALPSLPEVALRIVELIGSPTASLRDFAEVIKTDQALTGQLLRQTNAAHFAQRRPVTTLDRAVVLIGLERIKALALGVQLSRCASADGLAEFQRIWTMNLFRGWLAMRLAERLDEQSAGEAFVIGLMCDAGVPLMPRLVGAAYALEVDPTDPPATQYLAECECLRFTHADVVAALCELWKIPEELATPIARHHVPAQTAKRRDKASILRAVAYAVGTLPLQPPTRPVVGAGHGGMIQRLLGVPRSDLGDLVARAARDFQTSQELFAHLVDPDIALDSMVEVANDRIAEKLDLLVDAAMNEDGVLHLDYGGVSYRLERKTTSLVTVCMAGDDGAMLCFEEIDPNAQSAAEIRSALLLEHASDQELSQMIGVMRRVAA